MVAIGLVYNSIYDSTEQMIQKMIEASQRMINEENGNPAVNEHFKLQIKTLQNAPRGTDNIRRLLQIKQRESEKTGHVQDIERLVTEIGTLKFIRYLVNRNRRREMES